jgi:hypothetical protein
MSVVNPYASIEKRNFASALMRLLDEEYRFLGGPRVMQMLVEDVEGLIAEFYPRHEQAASGTLIWTCTADEGKKAQAGKPTEEYNTVTIRLPLLSKDEVESHTTKGSDANQRLQRQMVRLLRSAAAQGGLLTLAELSLMTGCSYTKTSKLLQAWHEQNGELLPLKGYRMDQGSKPTHKAQIIRLFEQGKEPPDIAFESGHSLKSVERYLKDYERVRMLLKSGNDADAISTLIGRGKSVVLEYLKLAQEFRPELFKKPVSL